jgi:hypothetical protein
VTRYFQWRVEKIKVLPAPTEDEFLEFLFVFSSSRKTPLYGLSVKMARGEK